MQAVQNIDFESAGRRRWPLRAAVLLIVLGTAHYVARDDLHGDDSTLQPMIEIASTVLAGCVALGASIYYRTGLIVRAPYAFLIGTLIMATAFAVRSWDVRLSLVRGLLLALIVLSTAALLSTYGLRPVVRTLIGAYVVLLLFGLAAGIVAPDNYPLMLHDPGEEELRARLHIFKIHPIALADDCAICLILSVILVGRWARTCRTVLLGCLLLTVARAPIILGLGLYAAAEALTAGGFFKGAKRLGAVAIVVLALMILIAATAVAAGWTDLDELTATTVRLVDATRDNSTLTGRTPLWSTLISDLSLENFYGYGVAGARYYLRTLNTWASHSHNSLLESIYVAGYPGLLAMLVAMSGALASALLNWRSGGARVLAMAGLYVVGAGMMEPSWYDASSMIVLALLCSCPWRAARPVSKFRVSASSAPQLSHAGLQSTN